MIVIINSLYLMKKYIQTFAFQYLLTIVLAVGVFITMGAVFGGVEAVVTVRPDAVACGLTAFPANASNFPACSEVEVSSLGFQIPTLGDILTFAIRAFFAIAGLAALFYMLLGAFAWVTSGGDKDAITAAREKIQAAVVGMILLVAVLAVIWTLEQVIFKRRICLGLSCSVTLPGLIESSGKSTLNIHNAYRLFLGSPANPQAFTMSSTEDAFCCVCVKDAGGFGDSINAHFAKCVDGVGKPL